MFKWQVNKLLHFIRNAQYKPTKQRLFRVNSKDELCACALGQVALGLNLVSEDEARRYAKCVPSAEGPVYAKIRDFFGENTDIVSFTNEVPNMNDELEMPTSASPAKFFNALADKLERKFARESGLLENPE